LQIRADIKNKSNNCIANRWMNASCLYSLNIKSLGIFHDKISGRKKINEDGKRSNVHWSNGIALMLSLWDLSESANYPTGKGCVSK
jgi:hypothetical protein